MRLSTKLIILALLTTALSCQTRRAVILNDSPRTGRKFGIDVDGNHIIIKNSSNTNIYIVADSARVDTLEIK